jgi:hypothetical protein
MNRTGVTIRILAGPGGMPGDILELVPQRSSAANNPDPNPQNHG